MGKCITQILDIDTGEVVDESKIYSYQTLDNRKRQLEFLKNKNAIELESQRINEKFKEYGKFIWNIYNINQQNFVNINPNDITRLMFLSTYLSYDGCLMYNQRTDMDKQNMNQLLKLSKREFQYFYKNVVSNKLLIEQNNKIYINKDIFVKGNLTKSKINKLVQQDKFITRLYVDGVRALYNKSNPKFHKTLSYLFQIMPYVNRQYNIVCLNPLEDNLDDIQCMSLGQFCDAINYNKHNVRQLRKMLFDPKFEFKNKTTSAIRLVSDDSNALNDKIFINPCIYYAGDKWEKVEVLGKF